MKAKKLNGAELMIKIRHVVKASLATLQACRIVMFLVMNSVHRRIGCFQDLTLSSSNLPANITELTVSN